MRGRVVSAMCRICLPSAHLVCTVQILILRNVWHGSNGVGVTSHCLGSSPKHSIMADDALARAGLHFDELNKIRVLEPEIATQTSELKEECKEFLDKMTEFQKIVGSFITVVDEVGVEVEKEKMKAIGSRNLLKSVAKQREAQQQQLQALIGEKSIQLERLRIQYASLQEEEKEQTEFIEQFVQQK